jgi:tetratricopeptide (TPR) repeat protein
MESILGLLHQGVIDWHAWLLGFLAYNVVELAYYLRKQSPLFLWRALGIIAKYCVGAILTWRYDRLYIDSVYQKFQEWYELYAPLEVWAQEISPGGLALPQTRVHKGPLLECIDNYQRVMLLGEAGSGKTTSLWRIALRYARRARQKQFDLYPVIPLYASLNDLKIPTTSALLNMLRDVICTYERSTWLERQGIKWGKKVSERVEELLEDGRVILLLDGISEVPGEIQTEAVAAIKEFLDLPKYAGSRVVLATRSKSRQDPVNYDIDELILMPFTDKAMSSFLSARKVHIETALRRLDSIDLKNACRNPGVLAMFADLYKRPEADLPLNRGQVFRRYVEELLIDGRGKWNSSYGWRWVDKALFINATSRLAYAMVSQGAIRLPIAKAQELIKDAISRRQGVEALDVIEQATFCSLTECLADCTEIRFKHDLLCSYFTAEELEHRLRTNGSLEACSLIADEKWWEPVLLQADITTRPVNLARSIMEASDADVNVLLALGCLLSTTADRLADENTAAVVLKETLSVQLVERLKIEAESAELQRMILQLAPLVGKPFVTVLAKVVDPVKVPDAHTRQLGVMLLTATGSEYAIGHLIDKLSDSSAEVRQEAALGLMQLDHLLRIPEEQISKLIELMDIDEAYRRATEVLLSARAETKLELLANALREEPRSEARATMRYLLYRLGDSDRAVSASLAGELEIAEKLVLKWVKLQIQNEGRGEIIDLLRADLDSENRRCFEPLLNIATHQDAELAIMAIHSLQTIMDPEALPPLAEIAADQERNREVRLAAIRAIYTIDVKASSLWLVSLLSDRDWRIREEVTNLLKKVGRDAVDQLLLYLSNDDADLRRDTARLLGAIGDRRAVPQIGALADDEVWHVRCAAAWAIGMIGDTTAKPMLERLSRDRNSFVRKQAVYSLEALERHRLLTPIRSQIQPETLFGLLESHVERLTQERPSFFFGFLWRIRGRSAGFFTGITDAEAYFLRRGITSFQQAEYLQAASDFSMVTEMNENNAIAYLIRAYSLFVVSCYEDAVADCQQALQIQPNWDLAHIVLAKINTELLRLKAALHHAEMAVALSPNLAIAHITLGDVYRVIQRFRDAEAEYLKALDLNAGLVGAHMGLALLNICEIRLEDCLARLNTAIDLAPNYGPPYLIRALLLMLVNRPDLAKSDLRSSLQSEPHVKALAYSYWALLEFLSGNAEEALKYTQSAEKANPYNYVAPCIRSFIWTAQGRIEEAIDECNRLTRLYPRLSVTYLCRSLARLASHQSGLALDDLNRFVSGLPSSVFHYIVRADIYIELGHRDLAWQDLEKVVELSPYSAFGRSLRSYFLVGEGNFAKALQEIDQAVRLAPSAWTYYWQRARLRMRSGDLAGAQDDLNSAKHLWPDGFPILDSCISLSIAQEKYLEAARLLDRLAELAPDRVGTGLKRSLLALCSGEDDEALRNYAELAPKARSAEIDTALLDLELAPTLTEEKRRQARIILEAYYKRSIDLLDPSSELPTIAPLLLEGYLY